MGGVGEEVEATVVPEKEFIESSMNIETASEMFRTMGEAMKAAFIPSKHTEGYVEAEVLSEGASGEAELLPLKTR